MIKSEQQGFAVAMVALSILVLGLIGGVGYYVASQNSNQEDSFSQSDKAETNEKQSIDDQKTDVEEKAFAGKEVNCNDQFTLSVPADWHFGTIENGGNCYVATQKELPSQGKLSGKDISFVFTTSKTSLGLSDWVEKYFNEREDGEFSVTKTSQKTIKLHNGDEAILASVHGGHSVNGNDKSMYFFYKKGSLGIFTNWDASTTDQALLNRAEEVVKTIN